MAQSSSLTPRPSQRHEEWRRALFDGDDALLDQLASTDDPAASLLELEGYINGIYRATQHPLLVMIRRASPQPPDPAARWAGT